MVVGTALVLLAVPLVVPTSAEGPEAVPPPEATGGMERLHLLPAPDEGGLPVIGDVTGRRVLLRGVNVNQLIDYYLRDPAVPATAAADRRRLRADRGDGVQRGAAGHVLVAAGADEGRVRRGVPRRDRAGRRVGEEARPLHRARHARGRLGQRAGTPRRAVRRRDLADDRVGRGPGVGDDHRRRAALPVHGTRPGTGGRDGVQQLLRRPRRDPDRARPARGRGSRQAFADEPAVAGYDLFNEPGIGASPPISYALLLGRYYDAAITAIRDAETDADGFTHLVFFEPSVLWSGLAFDVTPAPGFTRDTQLVFAPHPYSESISWTRASG